MALNKAKPKRDNRIDKTAIEAARTGVKPPRERSDKSVLRDTDLLAAAYCKTGQSCAAEGWVGPDGWKHTCSNRMEWAHVKSRGAEFIRHRPDNCFCLCNTAHRYFTGHPDAWTDFVREKRPDCLTDLNAILNERRDTKVKEKLRFVFLNWEAWYKGGAIPSEMPYVAPRVRLEVIK